MIDELAREIAAGEAADFREALVKFAAAGKLLELARDVSREAATLIRRNLPPHGSDNEVHVAAVALLEFPGWLDWEIHEHSQDLDAFDEIVMPHEVEDTIKEVLNGRAD